MGRSPECGWKRTTVISPERVDRRALTPADLHDEAGCV
jgi:hypothetical protein